MKDSGGEGIKERKQRKGYIYRGNGNRGGIKIKGKKGKKRKKPQVNECKWGEKYCGLCLNFLTLISSSELSEEGKRLSNTSCMMCAILSLVNQRHIRFNSNEVKS